MFPGFITCFYHGYTFDEHGECVAVLGEGPNSPMVGRARTRVYPTITLKGVVTKVDWTNPHVWFYINVKDKDTGKVTNWGAEMGPPHGLQRQGWKRETLKIGEEVTVTGSLAKNGSKRMNARNVVLTSTGGAPRELDAASSQGTNP